MTNQLAVTYLRTPLSASEFIENESFRRWVYRPAETDAAYWTTWLAGHPDDRMAIDEARHFLLRARGELPTLSDDFVDERIGRIRAAADKSTQPTRLIGGLRWLNGWQFVGVAASLLLVLGGGFRIWQNAQTNPVAQSARNTRPANPSILVVNQQQTARLVQLPDGSLVRLQPAASIRFLSHSTNARREVYLQGTAFFEVVKDTATPFFVYANGMTARVVGTSFTVQAPKAGLPTQILVRTGRVAVYPTAPLGKIATRPIMLTANQTATYNPGVHEVNSAKAITAWNLALGMPPTSFSFRRTPLPDVFQTLERAYRVSIQYDRALLAQRTLTARLDEESLFEKLNIIAASLDISYHLTPAGTIQITTTADAPDKTGY